METLDKDTKTSRMRRNDKVARLKALNWDAVQQAGDLFLADIKDGTLTEQDFQNLIQLTARLFEFIADTREVLNEPDSVSLVS
jgi:hypothetical protein